MKRKLEKIFKLKENNTNIKIDFIVGLTTFLAVMYILTVNPNNILTEFNRGIECSKIFICFLSNSSR